MVSALAEGVLVVAPSNAAVANAAIKVFASGRFNLDDLCVFGENCDPSVHFLSPRFRSEKHAKFLENYGKETVDTRKATLLAEMFDWLHVEEDERATVSMLELANMCPYFNMQTKNGRIFYRSLITESKVVFFDPELGWIYNAAQ
jgi:hypothetical protein